MKNNERKLKIRKISFSGVMLAFILALQMLNLPNLVTGVVVNAVLIFVGLYAGPCSAVILSVLSPVGGIVSGHMPPVMYPVLPVVAIGNVLMLVSFNFFSKKNNLVVYLAPATVKAAFIGLIGSIVARFFLTGTVVSWLVWSVLGIQFFTAALGIWLGKRLMESFKQKVGF